MTDETIRIETDVPIYTELHRVLLECCPREEGREPSAKRLAHHIGLSFQAVYKWIDNNRIPAKQIPVLVKVSEGRVTANRLLRFVL